MNDQTASTPRLGQRFQAAMTFAALTHAGQVRKGTQIPYLAHLLSVTALVLEHEGDEDEAIAALLHDAAEDQGGLAMLQQIRERFGQRVADIVEGCTDSLEEPKPPYRTRKRIYLEHLRQASPSILRVSIADKLHNARSILADYRRHGPALWTRFSGGRDGVLWYYRALLETHQAVNHDSVLLPELERVVQALEREVTAGEASAHGPG